MFKIFEYILAMQQIIVMHLLFNGSLGSLSFLGIGFMLLESQSVGLRPEVKQRLKKACRRAFAFLFLVTSFGNSR